MMNQFTIEHGTKSRYNDIAINDPSSVYFTGRTGFLYIHLKLLFSFSDEIFCTYFEVQVILFILKSFLYTSGFVESDCCPLLRVWLEFDGCLTCSKQNDQYKIINLPAQNSNIVHTLHSSNHGWLIHVT